MADKKTDAHGQPHIEFQRAGNKEKLLNDLLGVCEGLTADKTLSEDEAVFLDGWLKESRGLLIDDPDVLDIQDLVQDILKDSVVTADELEDLQGLLDCVCRHRAVGYPFRSRDQAIQRLLGLSRALIADRELSDLEIRYLQHWLGRCREFTHAWPFSGLSKRLSSVLADRVVTAEEREDLIDALAKLVGGAFIESGSAVGNATRAHEMDGLHTDEIRIPGSTFLFTGKFILGPRKKCEELVSRYGGSIASNISRQVNYLVVGTLSSRDWKHEAFGRKVEAAMQLRQEGHPVAVVSEEHWVRFLPK